VGLFGVPSLVIVAVVPVDTKLPLPPIFVGRRVSTLRVSEFPAAGRSLEAAIFTEEELTPLICPELSPSVRLKSLTSSPTVRPDTVKVPEVATFEIVKLVGDIEVVVSGDIYPTA
tara:strand:+ start:4936 stop:5280 length:345 start_codon:yes stop_codon:yes gene_type:complete